MIFIDSYAFGGSTPPPFVPTDIAGLVVWLDPSSLASIPDFDPIPSWPDSSGNGNDFEQATVNSQPLWDATANAAMFDGIDDFLEATGLGALTSMTAFIAVVFDSGTPNQYVVNFQVGNTNSIIAGFVDGTVEVFDTPRLSMGAMETAAFADHCLRRDAVAPLTSTFKDGVAVTSSGSIKNTPGSATWRLGSTDIGTAWFGGKLKAFLVYDSPLSTGDRNLVEGYLAALP